MKDDVENTFLLGIFIIIVGIILNSTFESREIPVDSTKDSILNKWRRIF